MKPLIAIDADVLGRRRTGDETYTAALLRELAPIADKCLGLLYGNHEHAFSRYYFIDVARYLAERFAVPMLGYTALLRLEIEIGRGTKAHHQTWPLTIFAEHGATGGGTDGRAYRSPDR